MMRRGFIAVLMAAAAWVLPPEARAQDAEENAQEKLRAALTGFVRANVRAYEKKTNELIKQLNDSGCDVQPSPAADGLPEPQTLKLTATHPLPALPRLRGDEIIDPRTVVVTYGNQRVIALDQETANLFHAPLGVPVTVEASVYRAVPAVCETKEFVTKRDGTRVQEIRRHKVVEIRDYRKVNIAALIGSAVQFKGGNVSYDASNRRLHPDGPGDITLPKLEGRSRIFERHKCGRRLKEEDQEIAVKEIGFSRAREAIGLIKLSLDFQSRQQTRDLFTGPNARNNAYRGRIQALIVGKDNKERFASIRASSAEFSMQPGGFFDVDGNQLLNVRPSGPPGKATLTVRPVGSTAGSTIGQADLTSSRPALVIDDPRPFIDDKPVIKVGINGPLPKDSGMIARWQVRQGAIQPERGDDPVPAGPVEMPLSIQMPSVEEVIRRRGIRAVFNVALRKGPTGTDQFSEDIELQLRPPPVEQLTLVGRRKGSDGEFFEGPFDLFRVQGSAGIEIAYRMRHRGGIVNDVEPRRATAFALQQTKSKGLKFSGRQDFPEITADPESLVPEAALRGVLRQTAAAVSAFSPPPGQKALVSETLGFTVNDVLLVIENLGRNGFVWRVLVDGPADMTSYSARYVKANGQVDTRPFQTDGASFVAENTYGARDVVQHVAIFDANGTEVARIDQRSVEAVVPRVSLDVPGVYKQGVDHKVTATISILGEINPLDLACQWRVEEKYGTAAFGSSFLQPIGGGFASCENTVKMHVDEKTLGRFPEVEVRLIRIPPGLGQ